MTVSVPTIKPDLLKKHHVWERVKALIEGDELKITELFCKQLPNESNVSYQARKKLYPRGFINPTIELLTGPSHTIYSREIEVDTNGDGNRLYEFANNCTKGKVDKTSLSRWMKEEVCPSLRAYGTVFVLVDMPRLIGEQSEQFQKENRIWPYVCLINPQSVLNYEFDDGELLWFAYKVVYSSPWIDPKSEQPRPRPEVRIWTRNEYFVIDEVSREIVAERSFSHSWGFVPILIQAQYKANCNSVIGESPFFATSNYIVTANDMYSTANIEVSKHSNLTLLLHQDAVIAANMKTDRDANVETKKTQDGAFIWYGENKPEYLTKDLDAVEKANERGDKYMANAFDNEKSSKSVAKSGYDGNDLVKSGFAMVVERDPIIANITATADDCELLQNNIMLFADIQINGKRTVSGKYVKYDKEYDLQPYIEFMDETEKFMRTSVSETAKKERQKKVNNREITDQKLKQKANDEVENYDFGDSTISDEDLNRMVDDVI